MSWITPVNLNTGAKHLGPLPIHQRRLFRNPRGLMYYYALSQDDADNEYYFYKSVDGVTWARSTVVVDDGIGFDGDPFLWIYEDPGNSRLIVYIAYWAAITTITAEAFTIADGGSDPASLWSNTVDTDAGASHLETPSICLADDGYLWVAWIHDYVSKGKNRYDVRCKCSTSTYPTSAPGWSTESVVFDGSGTDATGFESMVVVVPLTATADVGIVYKYYVAGLGYVLKAKTGTYAGAGAPSLGGAVTLDADTGAVRAFSVVTETGANSDVFVLYMDVDAGAIYCRKWDVSAGTSAAFGTVLAASRRCNLSINRTTETLYAFYEDQAAGKLYFKTSPESAASWSSEYTVDDNSTAIDDPKSSYEDLNDEIFVTYTYDASDPTTQRWFTTLLAAAYESNVRLMGTIIASYSAQVRNIGTVIAPFSALVRLIGSVHRSYSAQARLIGTIILPYSALVRNVGVVYRSYSAQVRNIGILTIRVVGKCHAELSVIRRRIF
ncbi:hypothetical protein HQ586_00585 [Candidatus Bathyarchaeota archaeon]|nr:hypothetical protein [Candidatus Bathyarchaeota archaeon]